MRNNGLLTLLDQNFEIFSENPNIHIDRIYKFGLRVLYRHLFFFRSSNSYRSPKICWFERCNNICGLSDLDYLVQSLFFENLPVSLFFSRICSIHCLTHDSNELADKAIDVISSPLYPSNFSRLFDILSFWRLKGARRFVRRHHADPAESDYFTWFSEPLGRLSWGEEGKLNGGNSNLSAANGRMYSICLRMLGKSEIPWSFPRVGGSIFRSRYDRSDGEHMIGDLWTKAM